MANVVDERIVKMEFDNKEFERNISKSLSSLDSFNKKLNDLKAPDSFDELPDKFNRFTRSFEDSAKIIENISNKFDFGQTFFRGLTTNLSNDVYKSIKSVIGVFNKVPSIIKNGGWDRALKIENAQFLMNGVLKDANKVALVMKEVDYGVSGTAYGLDEAAQAASRFAAAGVSISRNLKGNDSLPEGMSRMDIALRGVAGVAAASNSSFAEISDIFAAAAGRGRVMAIELNRLAARGFAASSTIKNFMNGVNDGSIEATDSIKQLVNGITNGAQISEQELLKMVSKGLINFDLFAEAMDTSFGEHAKNANATMEGAISNIKAALKKIGADFMTPIIQNAPVALNPIRTQINALRSTILGSDGAMTKAWAETIRWSFEAFSEVINKISFKPLIEFGKILKDDNLFLETFYNLLNIIVRPLKAIGLGLAKIFNIDNISANSLFNALEGFNSFLEKLNPSQEFLNILYNITIIFGNLIKAIVKGTTELLTSTEGIFSPISMLINFIFKVVNEALIVVAVLSKIASENKTVAASIILVLVAVMNLQKILSITSNTFSTIIKAFSILKTVLTVGSIGVFIVGIIAAIVLAIRNFELFKTIVISTVNVIKKTFLDLVNVLSNLITNAFSAFSEKIFKITNGFIDLSAITKYIINSFIKFGNVLYDIGKNVSNIFINIFEMVSNVIRNNTFGENIINKVQNIFKFLISIISNGFNAVFSIISNNKYFNSNNPFILFGKAIVNTFKNIILTISYFSNKLRSSLDISGYSINHFIQKLKSIPKSINFSNIKLMTSNFGEDLAKAIKSTFSLGKGVSAHELYPEENETKKQINLVKILIDGYNSLIKVFNKLVEVASKVPSVFNKIIKNIKEALNALSDSSKQLYENIATKYGDDPSSLLSGMLNTAYENIKTAVEKIKTVIHEFINLIYTYTNGFDLGTIATIAFVSIILMTMISLGRLIDQLSKTSLAFESFLKTITSALKGDILRTLLGFQTKGTSIINEKTTIIFALTVMIVALGGTVAALAILSSKYNLAQAAVTVGILAAVVTAMGILASKLTHLSTGTAKYAITMRAMLAMCASVFLLSLSIGKIAEVVKEFGYDSMYHALVAVSVLTALLGGIAWLLLSIPRIRKSIGNLFGLISIAVSLLIMVESIKRLSESISVTDMKSVLPVVSVLILMIAALALAVSHMHITGALAFLMLATELHVIIPVMIEIGQLIDKAIRFINWRKLADMSEEQAANFERLCKALVMMLGIVSVTLFAAAGLVKAISVNIIAVALAISLITILMNNWKMMDWTSFSQAISTIVIVFAGFATLIGMISMLKIDKNKQKIMVNLSRFILAFTFSTWLLVALGEVISLMPVNNFFKMIGIYSLIFAGIASLIAMTKFTEKSKADAITALTFFMLEIFAMMVGLSLIKPERLLLPTAAIVSIIAMLAILFDRMSNLNIPNQFTMGGIIAVMAAITLIAGELLGISYFSEVENILATGAAMSSIIITLSFIMSKMDKMRPNKDAWKALLGLMGVMTAIVVPLIFISKSPWKNIASSAVLMSGTILSLILVVKQLGVAGIGNGSWVTKMVTLLGVATMFASITIPLIFIASKPWSSIFSATFAIGALVTSMALVIKMLSNMKIGKNWITALTTMLGCASMILSITIPMIILSKQPWNGILASMGAMGASITALALLVYALGNMKISSSGWKKILVTLLPVTLMLISIGSALYLISSRPWNSILTAMGAMGASITALALLVKMLATSGLGKKPLDKIKVLLTATVTITLIATFLIALASFDWKRVAAAGGAMALCMASLAAMTFSISKLNVQNGDLVRKIAMLGVVLGAMTIMGGLIMGLAMYGIDEVGPAFLILAGTIAMLCSSILILSIATQRIGTIRNVGKVLIILASTLTSLGVVANTLPYLAEGLVQLENVEFSSIGKLALIITAISGILSSISWLVSKFSTYTNADVLFMAIVGTLLGSLFVVSLLIEPIADGLSNFNTVKVEHIGLFFTTLVTILGSIGGSMYLMKRFMSITKPKDLIELGIILSTLSLMIFGLKPLALAVRSADSFRLEALVKVAGMLSVIPGVILGLTVIAKRYAANKESLIAFGSIMGVLLVSIFGLKPLVNAIHSLDNLDAHSIGKVAEIMAAIPMMLGIISTVMGRFGGTWQQLASFGSLVSALALCIPIINGLAWSIKKMDSVTTDSIAKMAAVIVSISIVMGGMSTIMAKFGKKWKALAVSFGGLIIALALCIPIISGLAWSIKKMVDVRPQEIAKVAATLISTVGILGAISTLVQRFGAQMTGNTMQDAVSTGLYIVQLYFSMLASLLFSNSLPKIAKSLQALKSVRVNDIIKGGIVVLSIFGTISGISTALYKLTKSHSSNLLINLTNTGILILDMLALVSSFAIFAASVPMLISSLSEIRNIRIQEILKAGTIIGLVIGLIATVSSIMYQQTRTRSTNLLMVLVNELVLLADVFAVVGSLAIVISMLPTLASAFQEFDNIKTPNALAAIGVITACVAALVGLAIALASLRQYSLIGLLALAEVLGVFSGMVGTLVFFGAASESFAAAVKQLEEAFEAFTNFLPSAKVVLEDFVSIEIPENFSENMNELIGCLLRLTLLGGLGGLLSDLTQDGILTLTMFISAVNDLAIAFKSLSELPIEDIKTFISDISMGMLQLSVTMAVAGVLSGPIQSAGDTIVYLADCLEEAAPKIQNALEKIANAFNSFSINVGTSISDNSTIIAGAASDTANELEASATANASIASNAGQILSMAFENGFRDAIGYYSPPDFATGVVPDTVEELHSDAEEEADTAKEAGEILATSYQEGFEETLGSDSESGKAPDFVSDTASNIATELQSTASAESTACAEAGATMGTAFKTGFLNVVGNFLASFGNGSVLTSVFKSGYASGGPGIGTIFSSLFAGITGKTVGQAVSDAVVDKTTSLLGKSVTALKDKLFDKIKEFKKDGNIYIDQIKDFGKKIKDDVTDVTSNVMNQATDAMGGGLGGAGGSGGKGAGGGKGSKDKAEEYFDDLEGIVIKFVENYGEHLAKISDTDPVEIAVNSLEILEASFEEAGTSIAEVGSNISKTISNQMDIFKSFEKKTELSSDQLIENMRSQIEGIQEWASDLQSLGEKGVSQGLLQKLADLGPNGYEYVHAFVTMTEDQLKEANNLYEESLTLPDSATANILSGFAYAAQMAATGFSGYLRNDGANDAASAGQTVGESAITGCNDGIEKNAPIVTNTLTEFGQNVNEKMDEFMGYDVGKERGENFGKGMVDGMNSMTKSVSEAAENLSAQIPKVSAVTLDEHSPSKIAIKYGQYWGEGLARGISSSTTVVSTATEDLALSTFDSFTTMADDIQSAFSGYNPIISPILDTSYLTGQAESIMSALEKDQVDISAKAQTDWSNPSVREEFLNEMGDIMDSEGIVNAINNKDNVAQVYLEGDAATLFKVVQRQNRKFYRRTGYNGI